MAHHKTGRGVLEGAFLVLDALTRLGEAGLSQLAAVTALPKATTHRLLEQLVTLGAVQRQEGRYRIGPRMYQLGQGWQPQRELRVAARQPLRELAAMAGFASIGLAITVAGRSMLVGGMRGEVDEIRPLQTGTMLPHGCATDIVRAAHQPEGPAPDCYTDAEWRNLISRATDRGVAFDYEAAVWASCAGAPSYAPGGELVAALGVAVVDARRLAPLGTAVRRAANMITANLARPVPRPPQLK